MDILETLGKIGFDWRMGLANLVNFLIIFWLLKKYAFGPIAKKIKEREEKINQGLEDATKAAAEVTMAKENYDKKIVEAKKEANEIVAKASAQGKELIDKAADDAQKKSKNLIKEAKEVINKEKEKMQVELRAETIDLAFKITEKIIKEKLDSKRDAELIRKLTEK